MIGSQAIDVLTGEIVQDDKVQRMVHEDNEANGERPSWHNLVMQLHHNGSSITEIVEGLGQPREVVSKVILSPWGRAKTNELLTEDEDLPATVLHGAQMDAIYRLITLMENSGNERIQYACAKDLMHQGMGKPKLMVQNIEGKSKDETKTAEQLREQIEQMTQ